jgi:hypothetical protein
MATPNAIIPSLPVITHFFFLSNASIFSSSVVK